MMKKTKARLVGFWPRKKSWDNRKKWHLLVIATTKMKIKRSTKILRFCRDSLKPSFKTLPVANSFDPGASEKTAIKLRRSTRAATTFQNFVSCFLQTHEDSKQTAIKTPFSKIVFGNINVDGLLLQRLNCLNSAKQIGRPVIAASLMYTGEC